MKSLLIEEKDKTIREKLENLLIAVWPQVYRAVNGLVMSLLGTIRRIFQIIFEQLGLKRRY